MGCIFVHIISIEVIESSRKFGTQSLKNIKGKSNQGFSKSETTKIELVIGPAAAVALVMSAPFEGERWKLSCKRRRM